MSVKVSRIPESKKFPPDFWFYLRYFQATRIWILFSKCLPIIETKKMFYSRWVGYNLEVNFFSSQNNYNFRFQNKASRLESAEDFSKRVEWANNVYELKLEAMVNVCREQQTKKNGASSPISVSVINILLPVTFFVVPFFRGILVWILFVSQICIYFRIIW